MAHLPFFFFTIIIFMTIIFCLLGACIDFDLVLFLILGLFLIIKRAKAFIKKGRSVFFVCEMAKACRYFLFFYLFHVIYLFIFLSGRYIRNNGIAKLDGL